VGSSHHAGLRRGTRRADRRAGRAAGEGGLQAIYLSGWQVAADANLAGQTYPDQSLYPANSVPNVVRRINQALMRADQIDRMERTATAMATARTRTGSRRSSPTRRPASAAR
jgi:isocitrate lyase